MDYNFSKKCILVIDDMEGMRTQLRMTLSNSGFTKLHVVRNIREALLQMSSNRFDLILCDYALGESTDGQQFLEYLRTSDLISRNTIFIMITAEKSYEKVIAASECAPDDYLLKPFTAGQLITRLNLLLEKQDYFSTIDKATDSKGWLNVIEECDKKIVSKDKYYFDLCKIKGVSLIRDNRPEEAAMLYRELLKVRPFGWARLGLARALVKLDQKSEAQMLLREILENTPQFMAAYDFLGNLLVSTGEKDAALTVLQKAREVSPGTMSRIRDLSALAVDVGKPGIAENAMTQALKKNKYSPVIQANDYVVLSKALVNQGKAVEALAVVAEAKKSFKDEHSVVALATTESVAHRAAGNDKLAEAALTRAMAGNNTSNLSAQTVVSLAEACFAAGRETEAMGLLRNTIEENDDNAPLMEQVHSVLTSFGKNSSEATAMIDQITSEVLQLNNDGVLKAKSGQLEEAIELLSNAAKRLPNNLQIVGNTAMVIAFDMVRNGKTHEKMAKCLYYRDSLKRKSPNHPKLAQIASLLKRLT
jgi:tetratricopeptide (TPR) repeat protein